MPDTLMERVRAANPARPEEFAGLGNFDGLDLGRPPRRRRRHRRRLLALPVAGLAALVAAAFALLPAPAPQAKEVVRRAIEAMAVDDGGILYAETNVRSSSDDYGTRRVWVRGSDVRFRQVSGMADSAAGTEEITHDGRITRYAADGKKLMSMQGAMVPGEIFRSAALLKAAQDGAAVTMEEVTLEGRAAYALRWHEDPGTEMTVWVDRESYVPLRFTDHSKGLDVKGKPFDYTLTETVTDFRRLPDTPGNRRLLELHGG